jgi:hypothetical protein
LEPPGECVSNETPTECVVTYPWASESEEPLLKLSTVVKAHEMVEEDVKMRRPKVVASSAPRFYRQDIGRFNAKDNHLTTSLQGSFCVYQVQSTGLGLVGESCQLRQISLIRDC